MLGGSRFLRLRLRLRLLSLHSLADNGGSSILLKTSVGHLATIKRWDDSHVAIGDRQREVHTGKSRMLGTTVLCVRKNESVVIIGDGQVTLGSEIVKPNVKKVRRIRENVIGGFAGATADAFTLFERLENQLEEHSGELIRAAVELAKAWRTDKFLRRLDAVMVVANSDISLSITGNGDVLEPHDGIIAIGSGGPYAVAAARALIDIPNMDAETIARKAMKIAADSCIYTNHNFTIEIISSMQSKQQDSEQDSKAANVSAPDIQDMLNANSIPSTSTTTNDKSSSPADSLEMPLNNQGIHMSI